jgi:hypothetical protein
MAILGVLCALAMSPAMARQGPTARKVIIGSRTLTIPSTDRPMGS